MSRREGRDCEAKRLHSKREREPSPKRTRRDGKPLPERTPNNHNLDLVDHSNSDQKHRRRLKDALPLEAPPTKVGTDIADKEMDLKTNGLQYGAKHLPDPTEVPRSRSFFQVLFQFMENVPLHDERGSAGQSGRRFGRRAAAERGWWSDPKDQSDDRMNDKLEPNGMHQKDGRTQAHVDKNSVWRHDGFFELEAEPPAPSKKRPAFREKKMPPDSDTAGSVKATESVKQNLLDCRESGGERKEERGGFSRRDLDRTERSCPGDMEPIHRGERVVPPRERFRGSGSFRGRDKFSGRHGEKIQYHSNSFRAEKWKHDLFDEANRSPTPKNEEDQIAKVEALLAL
ncbi:uncharacterized protein LOC122073012 isoform X2 [Macadamia integrifolia]|uniref:uncharacterized protein LOC122073012 isoform X2 n=1 Tax=Macadamia integrifolia TaxID=60698 RepID=UPI001C4E4E21|nr:uncharacterized protein LOC122073012 isoform X2 [Macadamia integrifolia]